MSNEKRPRGRPPKFPPEVVRERLIDAAIATLLETGIHAGLESITLDAAIINAGVPRGMAYKIWQDYELPPQDALRREVLVHLLNLPTLTGLGATWELLEEELANLTIPTKADSLEKRSELVSELIRVVGFFNHQALDSSPEWRLYNAVRAVAITRSDVDPEIQKLLEQGESQIIQLYAELYESVSETFDVPLSESFTMHQFSAAVYALNEGLTSRLSTCYESIGIERTNSSGETKEWSLFAIGLEALVYQFFDL